MCHPVSHNRCTELHCSCQVCSAACSVHVSELYKSPALICLIHATHAALHAACTSGSPTKPMHSSALLLLYLKCAHQPVVCSHKIVLFFTHTRSAAGSVRACSTPPMRSRPTSVKPMQAETWSPVGALAALCKFKSCGRAGKSLAIS